MITLNQSNMKRYRCKYIDGGIDFFEDYISNCCQRTHSGSVFCLMDSFDGVHIDWDQIFFRKNVLKKNLYEGTIVGPCKGCSFIEEVPDDYVLNIDDNYIDILEINNFNRCNCRCIYCDIYPEKYRPLIKEYDIFSIIKQMFERKLLKNNSFVIFGGGEPTLLKNFDKIMKYLCKNTNCCYVIHSSGVKYSKAIAEALANSTDSRLVISIDSGTKETYKKIKRSNEFDRVCKNLKQYVTAAPSKVACKYIIVPGINDNLEDIDKWYNLSVKELGIHFLILDCEKYWFIKNKNNIPAHIFELIRHIEELAKKDNIILEYYEQLSLLKLMPLT